MDSRNDISLRQELEQERKASEYQELMKSETLLKTIKEAQSKRLLQPFDISKLLRIRHTTPLPMFSFRDDRPKGEIQK